MVAQNHSQVYLNSIIDFADLPDPEGISFAFKRLERYLSSDVPPEVFERMSALQYAVEIRDYGGIRERAVYLRNYLNSMEVHNSVEA